VRERRRQRRLPLPLADKVLPMRPMTAGKLLAEPSTEGREAEERMADAWLRLAVAEQQQASARELAMLADTYLYAVKICGTTSALG
jgi:hypothetical protein